MASLDLTSASPAAERTEWLAQRTRILCVLFFFSGFPALIYQLTWQRALFLIFGVNIESVTIVVTAFMLGLGVGSLAGGWLSKRQNIQLLPLLAIIELLTGAFGLVSLPIFDKVGDLTMGLSLPTTAVAALALATIPTLLMGATLPLLVGHLARRSGRLGSAIGLLYYVNTLGAGAACLACALLLFPFLGMSGSIYVAVALNGIVAFGAIAAQWFGHAEKAPHLLDAAATPEVPSLRLGPVLALAAAGGFISLSYEIFFFRTISYATGSSASTFALMLSAFLVGIASGARQAGEHCKTLPRVEVMRRMVDALLIGNLFGIIFLPLLDRLAWLDNAITGVAMAMVFLVARSWGSLLPYLAELSIVADSKAGMRTAILYLANILGSAAGSVITGFVLMEYLGLVSIATALVIGGAICVLLLLALVSVPIQEKLTRAAFAMVIGLVAVIVVPQGSAQVLENLQWKGAPSARRIVGVLENRNGIISVTNDGVVFGNGMYDGRFNTDLKNDTNGIVRPYALSLFHPAPRDVLMIGLSSGSWAQVVANNPDVASLTVIEINPGYLSLIKKEPEVASILTNPKITIVTDDGRRWLRANPTRHFDAIISNTTWHFRASATNLLSLDFLDIVRRHLNGGGIFFYNTTDSARVQRTGCLAFAHGAQFTNHMVVSNEPIAWDFQRWRRTLESYRIDGVPIFDTTRERDRVEIDRLVSWQNSLAPEKTHTVGSQIEPCSDLLTRTAAKNPITDDNMGTEWRHFMGLE